MNHRLLPLALTALLAACAAPSATPPLAPPPALTLSGVPAVPAELVRRVGPYGEFRGAALLDWSPDGASLLVAFRSGNTVQLHRARPGRPLEALTRSQEPTRSGAFVPGHPNLLVFLRDAGGDEATQIYRLGITTRQETQLSDAGRRHALGPFNRAGTAFVQTSVPLDRTAPGGTRERVTTEVALLEPASGARRVLATLPGTGWFASDVSDDDRSVLLVRYRSPADSEVWTLDTASGRRTRLLPRAGDAPAFFASAHYAPDGRRIFVATDRADEFRRLERFDPASGAFERVTRGVAWDVHAVEIARDRSRIAVVVNEAGRGVPRLYDAATLEPIAVPAPPGNVTALRFAPDARAVALAVVSAQSPSSVEVVDLAARTRTVWAPADTAGIDTRTFRPSELVEWTSFDGRRISGWITRPPARFAGPRPVLIDIHGGPAVQARLDFNGRNNYLINELGIVLIEPNVRGSTGFGKTFVALDDGMRREDAVRDIGALLDWIAAQPDLDAQRVAVQGGSYGGYMTLAVAVHYGDRIRAAISAVGISHFVTFLERTESYRRDLRRSEYGDERDPVMRAFLDRISPLTNAAQIRVPLFVLHGRNDPRVPVREAEQIVRTVRANGVPVWSLIAEDEGHGFAKKANADYAFYARVLFLERFLLRPD
ncbi:S9 family peptidase [Betaproteobacteria bacterium PRO7]|nr:S9 family peptidase [Betaproteobacteria bacterium PRO7]